MMKIMLISIFLSLCSLSCITNHSKSYSSIGSGEKATKIVLNSIEAAGGLTQWNSIKELSFNKDFQLMDSLGNIEKAYQQTHIYKNHPLNIFIESIENGDTIITELKNGQYTRQINGEFVEVTEVQLAKSVNTSTYVVGIPFKLLDAGTILKYEGESVLSDGLTVDIVSATYDAERNENHSTSDVWKYYFDKKGRVVANWVKASDHFSLVENLTYVEAGGILFNGKRVSYRVDENGDRMFLRANYNYYNYSLQY